MLRPVSVCRLLDGSQSGHHPFLLKPEIKSILIIKPSSLGDVVHTLPAVAAIRDANPKAEITWVINPEWTTLLRGNPDVDHVHIFRRGIRA